MCESGASTMRIWTEAQNIKNKKGNLIYLQQNFFFLQSADREMCVCVCVSVTTKAVIIFIYFLLSTGTYLTIISGWVVYLTIFYYASFLCVVVPIWYKQCRTNTLFIFTSGKLILDYLSVRCLTNIARYESGWSLAFKSPNTDHWTKLATNFLIEKIRKAFCTSFVELIFYKNCSTKWILF